MRRITWISLVIIVATIAVELCLGVGKDTPISCQLDILAKLRDVAAIIFGVMGAWIAIVYPDILKKAYGPNVDDQMRKYDNLVLPVLIGSFVIVYSISVNYLVYPILKSVPNLAMYSTIFRQLFSCCTTVLAILLIVAIVYGLWPMDDLRRELSKKVQEQKLNDHYRKR